LPKPWPFKFNRIYFPAGWTPRTVCVVCVTRLKPLLQAKSMHPLLRASITKRDSYFVSEVEENPQNEQHSSRHPIQSWEKLAPTCIHTEQSYNPHHNLILNIFDSKVHPHRRRPLYQETCRVSCAGLGKILSGGGVFWWLGNLPASSPDTLCSTLPINDYRHCRLYACTRRTVLSKSARVQECKSAN